MLTIPYVYRRGTSGSTTDVGELPGKICNVNQAIWMTARRDTLSGTTTTPIAPCLQCVTTWKDQSVNTGANDATLLNSARASNPGTTGFPYFNADYWTGDTTSNFKPFLSFSNRAASSVNQPNFLAIPYDPSFSRLTAFTFSTIFRARQISPNPVTSPGGGSQVVLFQNGNQTNSISFQNDGWGIDVSTSTELRIWAYDLGCSAIYNTIQGNSILLPVNDWTKWIRLTIRVSGSTMQANIYNLENYQTSGNTWLNGANNGGNGCTAINYAATPLQDWFIASQKGPDYPGTGVNQTILAGSWDLLEYVLYNNWLPDSCVQTIWDYYKTQYNFGKTTGSASTYTQIGTGTTSWTNITPVDLGTDYYWSYMIFPKASINKAGAISELQFNVQNSPTNNVLNNVKIYIGHTSTSAFPSLSVAENFSSTNATDWTLAYSGTVSFGSSPGWVSIPLQNGFYYNNTNNLLIKFESRDGSQSSINEPFFYYTTATNTVAYNSGSLSYPTSSGVRGSERANIKLGFI